MNGQKDVSATHSELVNRILSVWFLDKASGRMDLPQKKRWFMATPDFDQSLKDEFAEIINHAANNFERWQHTPESCLAYIVLLDQFTRNIFRGTASAFACDESALAAANYALENGYDAQLSITQRLFVYLPLEHHENLASQKKALKLFIQLKAEADESLSEFASATLNSAYEHMDIIEQFGRFPHRNTVLNRTSTPEEEKWLNEHNKRFGQ